MHTIHLRKFCDAVCVKNILVGKPEEKRPLGRPRHRWEDSIRMDLKEIVWEDVDWMHLSRDRD
jgi:hypothetical protein